MIWRFINLTMTISNPKLGNISILVCSQIQLRCVQVSREVTELDLIRLNPILTLKCHPKQTTAAVLNTDVPREPCSGTYAISLTQAHPHMLTRLGESRDWKCSSRPVWEICSSQRRLSWASLSPPSIRFNTASKYSAKLHTAPTRLWLNTMSLLSWISESDRQRQRHDIQRFRFGFIHTSPFLFDIL